MYTDYFGLSDKPFAITPDPRYLFLSRRHEEALAHLVYGVQEGGGFVQLTGEVGTGKTTLIKALLERLPDTVDVAFIFNPRMTAFEFLAAACDEFHVPYVASEATVKTLIDALNRKLLDAHAQGRRVVLIVDEAQNFHSDVLEQIRLLTNLETTKLKLLQIILVGQPELRDLLARRDLRQLAQRVTARYHLVPMTRDEVAAYVEHRLQIAGMTRPLFTRGALRAVWQHSSGVPRLVNVICDRALLGAYASEASEVSARIVHTAVQEVLGGQAKSRWRGLLSRSVPVAAGGLAVGGVVALGLVFGWWQGLPGIGPTAPEMASTTSPLPEAVSASMRPASSAEAPSTPAILAVSLPDLNKATARSGDVTRVTSLAEWRELLNRPEASGADAAFGELFASWGIPYARLVGTDGCEKAISVRLQCRWDRGSLDQFLSFDHPGLTWITDGVGNRHYAMVRGLNATTSVVAVAVGGVAAEVPLDVLRQAWDGHYVVLWQPPALDTRLLRPGARGDVVVWLRRTLDREQGVAPLALKAEQYDPELVERVKTFQRQRQLTPDGLVGEQTFMHLNALGGVARMPLLSTYAQGGE